MFSTVPYTNNRIESLSEFNVSLGTANVEGSPPEHWSWSLALVSEWSRNKAANTPT